MALTHPLSSHRQGMDLLALGLAAGAFALLIGAIANIFKGKVGLGIVIGVVALVIGGSAGAMAAYA
jgi:hypothetical protein